LPWTTLWASKGYPLFGQFHTEFITLCTFPKLQIFKKLNKNLIVRGKRE